MTKLTPLQHKALGDIFMGKWFYVGEAQAKALVKKGLVTEHRGHVLTEYQLTKEGINLLAES